MKELDDAIGSILARGKWVDRTFCTEYGRYEFKIDHPDADDYNVRDEDFDVDDNHSGRNWYIQVNPLGHEYPYYGYYRDSSDRKLEQVIEQAIRGSGILSDLINYERKIAPDFDHLQKLVRAWAWERGIFKNGTPVGQANKTLEEAQEILDGIRANDKAEIADGLGDTLVTLIVQAEMQGMDLIQCLHSAYLTIADRTGRIVNGVFIRDK